MQHAIGINAFLWLLYSLTVHLQRTATCTVYVYIVCAKDFARQCFMRGVAQGYYTVSACLARISGSECPEYTFEFAHVHVLSSQFMEYIHACTCSSHQKLALRTQPSNMTGMFAYMCS